MVNIGRPSRGCAVCRRRRIKCDEKEPQCSYCVKTKQACPGYKDDFTLAWRDQTATAREKVQRRKQGKSLPASQLMELVRAKPRPQTIPAELNESLDNYALSFFFNTHVAVDRNIDTWAGFMEYLPQVYSKGARPGSPLFLSTLTVATRMLEPWIDEERTYSRSRAMYYRALSKTREQLEGNLDCWSDEFLMTVLLLDFFEKLQSPAYRINKNSTHINGAVELVRRRPVDTYGSDTSMGLLLSIRNQLVINSLNTKTPFPGDVMQLMCKVGQNYPGMEFPKSHMRTLDLLKLFMGNLQASLASLGDMGQAPAIFQLTCCEPVNPCCIECAMAFETETPATRSAYFTPMTVLQQALQIELNLEKWEAGVPSVGLRPSRVTGDSIPQSVRQAGLYQDHALTYPTVFAANMWLQYHVSDMRIHSIILDCIEKLRALSIDPVFLEADDSLINTPVNGTELPPAVDLDALTKKAHSSIQTSADEICATVPFFVGDRTKHSLIADDRNVKFPMPPTGKIPVEQWRTTSGMARWFLMGPFGFVLGVDSVYLREGQKDWIRQQLVRLEKVHGGRKVGEPAVS